MAGKNKLQIGFLASHNGTDMRGIVSAITTGKLAALARVVISNNSGASSLEFARQHNIPAFHISQITEGSPLGADEQVKSTLIKHQVNLVILSGFMKRVGPLTRAAYPDRIINVHPALLPKYAGLWGDAVHQAVLASGDSQTGVTLHTIAEEYDQGRILRQDPVPVLPGDTIDTLRNRVQNQEVRSFIEFLNSFE